MIKKILIALAFAASYLGMSGTVQAQSDVPCRVWFDATAGVLCGTGGTNVGATNFVILGGVSPAFAGDGAVAVGAGVRANGNNSVGVGRDAFSTGLLSTAVGYGGRALGSNSLTLGANATAGFTATNSVALGAGSATNEANVVSVGTAGNERRIVNVGGPIALTDAANRQYVDNAQAAAQDFATVVANQARVDSQGLANLLMFDGTSNANLQSATVSSGGIQVNNGGNINLNGGSINVNGGGINNAGRITGVANGIAQNDAVNLSQLTTAAGIAQANSQNFATSLVTSGTTATSVASVNVNGGGITNAGTISGVTAATQADQAVNYGQMQTFIAQLVRSGVCRIEGGDVSCGAPNATGAIAVGGASVGDGADDAIAVGTGASAQSAGGIAMGLNATAVQANSVAIGAGARANSSVALGTGAQATGTNTTAVGDNSNAAGQFAVAVGNNATATHDNSVAIGNGSQTSAANTVSVGTAGAERRITNVAAGTAATDAVNLGQLNNALVGLNPQLARQYTDQQTALTNARMDTMVKTAREYAARGIAASSALPTAMPSQVGKTAFNVGAGNYDGETAVGLSIAHSFTRHLMLSGSIAQVSGGDAVSRVGIGFEF